MYHVLFFAKEKPRSFGLISIDFSSEMQFDTCVGRSIGKHGQWWLKKCCNGYAHLKSLQIEGVTSAGYWFLRMTNLGGGGELCVHTAALQFFSSFFFVAGKLIYGHTSMRQVYFTVKRGRSGRPIYTRIESDSQQWLKGSSMTMTESNEKMLVFEWKV